MKASPLKKNLGTEGIFFRSRNDRGRVSGCREQKSGAVEKKQGGRFDIILAGRFKNVEMFEQISSLDGSNSQPSSFNLDRDMLSYDILFSYSMVKQID